MIPYNQLLDSDGAGPFADKDTRRYFLQDVFAVFFGHNLLFSTSAVLFSYIPSVQDFLKAHDQLIVIFGFLVALMIFVMIIFEPLRTDRPLNGIIFIIFTLVLCAFVGMTTSFLDFPYAWVFTLLNGVTFILLEGFVSQSYIPFTLLTALVNLLFINIVVFYTIVYISFSYMSVEMVWTSLASLASQIYVVFDTMLVVKDLHYAKVEQDNYIHMALNIYVEPISFLVFLGSKLKAVIISKT